MSQSQVAACEDKLVALLAADATLSTIRGVPHLLQPLSPELEDVWLDQDVDASQDTEMTSSTGGSKSERFDLVVRVFVAQVGSTTQTAEAIFRAARDRCDDLADRVEIVVRNNMATALNGTVPWFNAEVTRAERTVLAIGDQIGVLKGLTVAITARPL